MIVKSDFLKALFSVGGGSLILNLGRIVTVLISTRFIDAEKLGIYFILIAAAGVIASVAACGTNVSLVKYVVEEESSRKKYSIVVSSILFFCGALLAVTGFSVLLNRELDFMQVQPSYIYLGLSFGLFFYLNSALQGLKKFRAISVASSANGISKVIASIVFIAMMGLGFEGLVWTIIISNIIGVYVQISSLFRGKNNSGIAVDVHYLWRIIKFSFPIYLNQLYSNFYDRGYMILIAAMLDPVAVAYYGVAKMIPSFIDQVYQVYNSVYFPKLCALLKDEDEKRASLLLSVSIVLAFTVIAFGSIIFYLFQELIISIVFSSEYTVVALAAFILLARSALTFCAATMGFSLVALGNNTAPLKINLFITTLSFAASYLVIPYFGYMGVIYVAFTSAVLGLGINYLYLRHVRFPVQFKSTLWAAFWLFNIMVLLAALNLASPALLVAAVFTIVSVYSIHHSGVYRVIKGLF